MNTDIENNNEIPKINSQFEDTLKKLEATIGQKNTVKIVKSFLDDSPKALEAIRQFLTEKNLDELHKIGHRNKSSAVIVGANDLTDLFNRLEVVENIESATLLSEKIEQASTEVKLKLDQYLNHLEDSAGDKKLMQ